MLKCEGLNMDELYDMAWAKKSGSESENSTVIVAKMALRIGLLVIVYRVLVKSRTSPGTECFLT
jgi:hypothetical protein